MRKRSGTGPRRLRLDSRLLLGVTLAAAIAASAARARSQPARPNILFVLADQWRAAPFGFAGNPEVGTPHLDRLARESVWCVNAVAGVPVCCPTRASLMTGRRPLTHGVFMNDVPLRPDAVTMARVLRQERYDTGY